MKRIYFNEVVTRDGFQMEPDFVPTDAKIALIDELSACGYAKIEVTSFTSAKAIPMLRDAEEVMGRIRRVPGVEYAVLVPNLRGAERALESRADELNLVMSASRIAQPGQPAHAARAELRRVDARSIRVVNGRAAVNVSLSTCFGCPMEGDVPQEEVLRLGRALRRPRRARPDGLRHHRAWRTRHRSRRMCEALQRALRRPAVDACTSTTRAAWAWPMCWRRCRAASCASTARSAAWAAARTPPAPAATSAARTPSTCCEAMGYDTGHRPGQRLLAAARRLAAASSAMKCRASWPRPAAHHAICIPAPRCPAAQLRRTSS